MRLVSFDALQPLLAVNAILDPVRNAFRSYSSGAANIPPVQHLEMPYNKRSALHIKSGHVRSHDFCVVKIVSTFPENARAQPPSPSLDGVLVIFSTANGQPLALIEDRASITQARTAAAGVIAAELLAPAGARRLGIIGTGAQARLQTKAICSALPRFTEVRAWGRTSPRLFDYITELSNELPGVSVQPMSTPEEVVRASDVLVTATYATEPIVQGSWLPAQVLVIGLGADGADKQELDADCISLADAVVVDSRAQNEVLAEIGRGIRNGAWTPGRMDAEIGELLAGAIPGKLQNLPPDAPARRVICKLTGVAAQEIFVCDLILRTLGIL